MRTARKGSEHPRAHARETRIQTHRTPLESLRTFLIQEAKPKVGNTAPPGRRYGRGPFRFTCYRVNGHVHASFHSAPGDTLLLTWKIAVNPGTEGNAVDIVKAFDPRVEGPLNELRIVCGSRCRAKAMLANALGRLQNGRDPLSVLEALVPPRIRRRLTAARAF